MKTFLLLSAVLAVAAQAAAPVVSNVRASQIAGTKNVEILFDVSDSDGDALTIGVQVSGDAGQTYTIPATALSGHIGAGVAPGLNRRIVWNAGADWNGQLVSQAKVRVTASDGTTPAPPPGMVYIPAGVFQMGDNLDGLADALPVHNVTLDAFFIEPYEVSRELWIAVAAWGVGHGYSILTGQYKDVGHPVQTLWWHDAVKWCNARSEKEGLIPCYYTDDAQTAVYRAGSVNITNAQVKWTANGYRLPTEAEWEKAARGGSFGLRYPWGDTINGNQANYDGNGDPFDSDAGAETTPVGYYNGSQVPAGSDMANGYGLYDVAGNVFEWCWDRYSASYYGDATAENNPRGSTTTNIERVRRGGAWNLAPINLRVAQRALGNPGNADAFCGMRCVRGVGLAQ